MGEQGGFVDGWHGYASKMAKEIEGAGSFNFNLGVCIAAFSRRYFVFCGRAIYNVLGVFYRNDYGM